MFAASKTAAVVSGAPPSTTTVAKTFDYASGLTAFGQSVMLSDGKFAVALQMSSYVGFQIINTDGTLSGNAIVVSGLTCIPTSATIGQHYGGIACDASDNIFISHVNGVIKFSRAGAVLWAITGFPTGFLTIGYIDYNATYDQLVLTSSNRSAGSGFNTYLFNIAGSTGAVNWARSIIRGGIIRTEMDVAQIDAAGNCFAAGLWGSYNAAIVKFDNTGTVVWQKSYGFDGTSAMVCKSTGYSILGTYNADMVRVYDTSGTIVSGVNYTTNNNSFNPIVYLNSDNTYITGGYDPTLTTSMFLMKHAANGSIIWSKRYKFNATTTNAVYCINKDTNGNYIITGSVPQTTNDAFYAIVNGTTGVVNASSATWTESATTQSVTLSTAATGSLGITATIASFTPSLSYVSRTPTTISLTPVLSS
jgi:hypothetical protein